MSLALVEHAIATGGGAPEQVADLLARLDTAERVLVDTAAGVLPVDAGHQRSRGGVDRGAGEPRATSPSTSAELRRRYPAVVESAVYFACLEAVNNAHKHAPGARITVTVRDSYRGLEFAVDRHRPRLRRRHRHLGAAQPVRAGRGRRRRGGGPLRAGPGHRGQRVRPAVSIPSAVRTSTSHAARSRPPVAGCSAWARHRATAVSAAAADLASSASSGRPEPGARVGAVRAEEPDRVARRRRRRSAAGGCRRVRARRAGPAPRSRAPPRRSVPPPSAAGGPPRTRSVIVTMARRAAITGRHAASLRASRSTLADSASSTRWRPRRSAARNSSPGGDQAQHRVDRAAGPVVGEELLGERLVGRPAGDDDGDRVLRRAQLAGRAADDGEARPARPSARPRRPSGPGPVRAAAVRWPCRTRSRTCRYSALCSSAGVGPPVETGSIRSATRTLTTAGPPLAAHSMAPPSTASRSASWPSVARSWRTDTVSAGRRSTAPAARRRGGTPR